MRTQRWPLLLIGAALLLPLGLGAVLLLGNGDDADAGGGAATATPPARTFPPTATPTRREIVERVLDPERDYGDASVAFQARRSPEGAIRDYFETTGRYDYRSLSHQQLRAAQLELTDLILERTTGAARSQMLAWFDEYLAPNLDPGPVWLWRQHAEVESTATIEQTTDYARVAASIVFTRWFSNDVSQRVRSRFRFELHRSYDGIWRMAGWEALGDTLIP